MSSSPYTQSQILLIKAAEDEKSLHVPGNPESILGFHAQPAVEKLLKALMAALSIPIELTNNLSRLQNGLHGAGERLPVTPLLLSQIE